MNGPEHYRRAEQLLTMANGQDIDHAALTIASAQVHATLALAAATAADQATAYDGDESHDRSRGWAGVS